MSRLRRVVIVGGGVAGVSAAAALRAGGFEDGIVLLEAGGVPYDRPPLSKEYLAGTRSLGEIALRPDAWYDEQRIDLRTHTPAARIRPESGAVELADGSELSADRVVLATGGQAARPPIPGADDPRVHVLRTSEDADRLRQALVAGRHLLVVGGGLIGAEVASTALAGGLDVTLADPVATPLGHVVGEEVAAILHAQHAQRGISTRHCGVTVIKDDGELLRAELDDGTLLEADAVLLGVGMRPETALAETAGLALARGVVVDESMTTSNPHILAVGDPVRILSHGVLAPAAEHWDAAIKQGARAAATILGQPPAPAEPTWFWSDRHQRHVEVVGQLADADQLAVRGDPTDASWSAFGFKAGQLVGAVAVNDSHAVRAATRMISRAIVVDPAALADPTVDLRKLVRSEGQGPR